MAEKLVPRKPRTLVPFGGEALATWRDELENMMTRFWDEDAGTWFQGAMRPSVDLSETAKTLEVRMDIPGVTAKDIDIQIQNNLLTVSGERKEEKEEKGKTFHRVERRSGSFARTLTLPCPVVEDEVAAEYKDGTLTITLPKTGEAQAHKIEVKT